MYLPDFEYYTPDSVEEACQVLSKFGPKAIASLVVLDIVVKMKRMRHRKSLLP